MGEGEREARAAWNVVLGGLQAIGWKVTRRAGREAIYTTTEGRVGTLTLRPYSGRSLRVWRWTVDYYSVRWPRLMEIASPAPPTSYAAPVGNELTCAVGELAALAPWLVEWLRAYDRGPDGWPVCPVALERRGGEEVATWSGGYTWTVAANRARCAPATAA